MIWGYYLVSQGDHHKALFYQCFLRTRRLASAVNCGRRGWSDTRRLKKKQKDTKTRIVKNGKDPFRVVGGDVALENEIPWQVFSPCHIILQCSTHPLQVAILKSDNSWDGCGALLLSCDPLIVITAAHCVHK